MNSLLRLKDLSVRVAGKEILKGVDLDVKRGQTYVIFGPNGSGKTSLINAIMSIPGYEITKGTITFDGKDITSISVNEKAKLGLGIAFQIPPEIRGIKLREMLKICARKGMNEDLSGDELDLVNRFNLGPMLDRDINFNFSGGERKKSEVLQIMFMKPKLLILDEPDSGVDVESVALLGREIQNYLSSADSSALMVTHHGHILDYVEADEGTVLMKGTTYCYEDPKEILDTIREVGYERCIECEERKAKK